MLLINKLLATREQITLQRGHVCFPEEIELRHAERLIGTLPYDLIETKARGIANVNYFCGNRQNTRCAFE